MREGDEKVIQNNDFLHFCSEMLILLKSQLFAPKVHFEQRFVILHPHVENIHKHNGLLLPLHPEIRKCPKCALFDNSKHFAQLLQLLEQKVDVCSKSAKSIFLWEMEPPGGPAAVRTDRHTDRQTDKLAYPRMSIHCIFSL